MANRNLAQSTSIGGVVGGLLPALLTFTPDLIITGDSKSNLVSDLTNHSALFWALSSAQLDCRKSVPLGVGASTTGPEDTAPAGLTSPSRLAALQSAISASLSSGGTPVVIVKAGTNDGSTFDTVANMRKFVALARSYGARAIIIMSIDPRGTSATATLAQADARRYININHGYRQIAAADQAVIFVDTTRELGDQTSALFGEIGHGQTTGFAAMYDGYLHESTYGAYLQKDGLARALAKFCPTRRPFAQSPGDVFDATYNPRGNVVGPSNILIGTTGGTTANVLSSGGGGVTGAANWPAPAVAGSFPQLSGSLSGTLALAISVVNNVAVPLRNDGTATTAKATRLTFSGTPTSAGNVQIDIVGASTGTTGDWTFDAEVVCNALTGCKGLQLTGTPGESGASGVYIGGSDGSYLPTLNGRYLMFRPGLTASVGTGAGYAFVTLNIYWAAGVAMSGSIDLSSFALWHEPTLQAASA